MATRNVVDEMTLRLLRDAGVSSGWRVLDLGCGRGDVALMLSKLVGETGSVLTIDRDEKMLDYARNRFRELKIDNVSFENMDLNAPALPAGTFDAIVARRVLMYLVDPIATLSTMVRALRAGGVVVVHENDASMVPASQASFPLHERVQTWIWETVKREGANLHMGFDLHSVLGTLGLTVEDVRAEAVVQTPDAPYFDAAIIRAMRPRIVQHGVASDEELDVDTLEARLDAERALTNSTFVSDMVFGAWARKPSAV